MKKTVMIILGISALLLMAGCSSDTTKKAQEVKTYKYSVEYVYTHMCVKCHGKHGEGVKELNKQGKPKGPAINDQELHELKLSITDIKNGGLNQSSGTDHDVMEHNYQAIKKKGMDYDTDKMAEYIYNNFYVK
jgi:cytochrome c553